ncbi:hypothetical protein NE237_002357 [Protea cynaroides]|uniref:Uncharacterized protein n=1 Tax=Protea cynaroides TaxID=273540 RepID=A0A9Q0KVR8_9MAGN|nr:hypothetical protein NE237_002357 [Protea cynaroides]
MLFFFVFFFFCNGIRFVNFTTLNSQSSELEPELSDQDFGSPETELTGKLNGGGGLESREMETVFVVRNPPFRMISVKRIYDSVPEFPAELSELFCFFNFFPSNLLLLLFDSFSLAISYLDPL